MLARLQQACRESTNDGQNLCSYLLAGNTSKCLVRRLWSEVQHADHLIKLRGVPVVDIVADDGQLPTNQSWRPVSQQQAAVSLCVINFWFR